MSRNSMYFDDLVDDVVEDDDDEDEVSEEGSDEHSEDLDQLNSAGTDKERVFLRLPTSHGGTHPTTPATHDFGLLASVAEEHEHEHDHDSSSRDLGGQTPGGTASGTEDGGQVKLEAGIVDYCVMLGKWTLLSLRGRLGAIISIRCAITSGPVEPFSLLKPTHCITSSGALASLPVLPTATSHPVQTHTSSVPCTPQVAASYTGLFSENSSEEQEMVIWDRLPRHDHFGIEMPSKVGVYTALCQIGQLMFTIVTAAQLEWFACPEGSKTVLYRKR
jgi:hypothetical protein